jgi:hypothetical protein
MRIPKVIIFSLCLLVLFCDGAMAGGALMVDQKILEFGSLKEGMVAKKTVTVSNTGDAPVTIVNVSTSCSCTTTTLVKDTLKPGESTPLEIVYNTYKFPGKFEKYVTLAWGVGGGEQTVITMFGDVAPIPMGVLDVAPRKVEAGDMVVGKPVSLTISIRNTGDAALHVDKVMAQKSGAVFFDADKDSALTLNPGEEKSIPVLVTAFTPGNFVEYALIFSDARNVTDKGYKVVIVGLAK